MHWEVEQKFRVVDQGAFVQQCTERGIVLADAEEQIDVYLAHPARNFAQTDEAFRLRSCGDRNWVTYKGPKLDPTTKTRRELELPLPDGVAYQHDFQSLLEALSFRPAGTVRKLRRRGRVLWQGTAVEVSLDEVDLVGSFVEFEIVVDREEAVEPARQTLFAVAADWGLSASERRSYLHLVRLASGAE